MPSELPSKPTPPNPERMSAFAKYSGIGIQMLATIGLCTWLGIWLDGRFGLSPWGTVGLTLLGVFAAMYQVIRSVSEK